MNGSPTKLDKAVDAGANVVMLIMMFAAGSVVLSAVLVLYVELFTALIKS